MRGSALGGRAQGMKVFQTMYDRSWDGLYPINVRPLCYAQHALAI
jgi:hypothetical protein